MHVFLAFVLGLFLAAPGVDCQLDQEGLRMLRRSGSLFWINRQRLNKFKPHRTSLSKLSSLLDISRDFQDNIEFGPMHDLAKAQYGREFQRKLEQLEKMNLNNEI